MKNFPLKQLVFIAVVVGVAAFAFAYTAGWLSPHRLTPDKLLAALQSPSGPPLGHRRNHSKGICFTGTFDANGEGVALSKAEVFARGQYPVVGRFNFAGSDPNQPDPMAQVRGFSVRITTPDGQEWRSAMLEAPVFLAPTAEAFYQFVTAAGSKDPNAMKEYIAAYPGVLPFLGWAKDHPHNESWAEDRFNGLNAFIATDASGTQHAVRWSYVPTIPAVALTSEELASRGPNFLQQDITDRVAAGPLHWELVITVANPGDPTADATKAWPSDRRTVDVGMLTVQQIEPEANGPCRDINYDPVVLPTGITTSDDPIPAARSAAYAQSFNRRTAEESDYPRTPQGGTP